MKATGRGRGGLVEVVGRYLPQPVVERMDPPGADRDDPLAVLQHPLDPEERLVRQREPGALETV